MHDEEPMELYVPAAQLVQALPALLYVPALHRKHDEALELPASED